MRLSGMVLHVSKPDPENLAHFDRLGRADSPIAAGGHHVPRPDRVSKADGVGCPVTFTAFSQKLIARTKRATRRSLLAENGSAL